jgi:ribonuclease BN (tRNA processing enzyme)
MSDREAGITAREGGAKRLCLYHLPGDGDLDYMRRQAAMEFGGEVHTPDLRRVFYL